MITNAFSRNQLLDLDLIDDDQNFDSHLCSFSTDINIWGENWSRYGGHDDDQVGYFYLSLLKADMITVQVDRDTGKILSQTPHPKYKFGRCVDIKKRIERYTNDRLQMEVVYWWNVRAFKTLETFIKQDILDGRRDDSWHPFALRHYKYWADNGANSTWGMSEWMHFDEEKAESFARDVDMWIASSMYHKKAGRRDSFKMSHYVHGKTELYFDESKEMINRLYSKKLEREEEIA